MVMYAREILVHSLTLPETDVSREVILSILTLEMLCDNVQVEVPLYGQADG